MEMETKNLVVLFIAMGAVTFIPRWFPLVFLSGRKLPDVFVEWLDLIPVSILSALLLPALVTGGTPKVFNPFRLEMIVAVPTFIFALKTKSLGGTVIFGMALFWLFGKLHVFL